MGLQLRTALFSSVALAGLALAAPALAQAPASGADEGGDIVVTARRREESLIDVPIAMSAISGTQLERTGAIDITDISNSTPNVTLEVSRGTNSTLTAFIRGVGQQDPVAGFEAGVGLYLDDVYLNRPQAAVLDIYDVERIEVLRGPQGTLYGRNTIGGAVKYVTKRIADRPTLSARATYGSYDQADGVISASVPVGEGILRVGGSLARLSRGGFGRNLTTGLSNYNKDIWAGRVTAEVHATDAFFRLSADYTKDDSNPRGGHRLIPSLATATPPLSNVYDSRGALVAPKQSVEAFGVSLFGEVNPTDTLTFRSITAFRKDDSSSPIDFDSLAAVDVDVPAFYNNQQFSQELQVLLNTGSFNGLLGAYYLNAKARTVFDVRLPGGVLLGVPYTSLTALTFGNVDTDTAAIFGDFTYDIASMFSVSVGGRYTWDTRSSKVLRQSFLNGGSPYFGGNGFLLATTSDFTGRADFARFTPRASVSFKPAPDHNIYASYSEGFKGGGFDPRGQTSACRNTAGGACTAQEVYDFIAFDPETVTSYEVGYKASMFDRALTFALSAFHADYTDVQVPGSIGTTVGGVQTFIGITTNAGKARIRGVEFEGNLVARDAFTNGDRLGLGWAVGYIDAQYTRFIDARGIDVSSKRRFQNTPDWTISETLSYNVPVASGTLNASTTLSYKGDSQQFELATPGLDQGRYMLLDASLVWTSAGDRWSIGIHGRNLLDRRYIVAGYNFLNQNPDTGQYVLSVTPTSPNYLKPGLSSALGNEGVLTAYYGSPRQVFATVGVKF